MPFFSADTGALVSRSWNGTPISRRTTDGYVNATAMCKANKKRWSDYRESDRCQLYLDALSQTTEIPVFDLI
ncbi:MAG: KilA-N domain-containing protein, partial [Micrococcales bacterium]|nr:KilA-N domain-containing protein [Micrococcales bacterium]